MQIIQKLIFIHILISFSIFCGCIQRDKIRKENFVLAKNGKAIVSFLLTAKQAEAKYATKRYGWMEKTLPEAIKDFNVDLKECIGYELPVISKDDGKSPIIRFNLKSTSFLDDDSFSITFPDSRSMLIAGNGFGIRCALNYILENFAGVRYLARSKDSTHYPQIKSLELPRKKIKMAPSFTLRRTVGEPDSYWFTRSCSKWGAPINHELRKIPFPVKKYIKENKWPDYIFPTIDGKKFLPYMESAYKKPSDYKVGWQPCLSNKKTIDEAVKNICDYFDKNPEAPAISMAINDVGKFCQCDKCREFGGLRRNRLGKLDYSDLYYQWLNEIVERVAQKYPDKYFACLAYCEVIEPPSFKLHKNIIPFICFDAHACLDPKIRKSRLDLFKEWSIKADRLGWWDYGYGGRFYEMPRVDFKLQRDMIKLAYENNVRAIHVENGGGIEDGPKKYIYKKLMWDVNANLDMLLHDWYVACVGKKAAPYLDEYYRTWEKIWREEAIKTDWFQSSKKNTYLSLGNNSYLYAVNQNDMTKLRKLMEKVLQLANRYGNKKQKLRAKWLMRDFSYSEACVYALGGQIFPPSGNIEDTEQALAYLKFLPDAVKYDAKRAKIFKERQQDSYLGNEFKRFSFRGPYVPVALSRIALMGTDPKIVEAFCTAIKNPALPPEIRGLLSLLIKLSLKEPVNNLFKNGSFENAQNNGWSGGKISSEKTYDGKYSLKLSVSRGNRMVALNKNNYPVKQGYKYLVSAMIYVEQKNPDVEEYVKMRVMGRSKGQNRKSWKTPQTYIKPGRWTRISVVADITSRNVKTIGLNYIAFYNYPKGTNAYIDDIIITPLEK